MGKLKPDSHAITSPFPATFARLTLTFRHRLLNKEDPDHQVTHFISLSFGINI